VEKLLEGLILFGCLKGEHDLFRVRPLKKSIERVMFQPSGKRTAPHHPMRNLNHRALLGEQEVEDVGRDDREEDDHPAPFATAHDRRSP
jgi:hypothetical protein